MSSRRNRRSSGQHRPVDVQGVESPVGSTASTASVTSESCPTTPRSPFPSSPVPNDAMSPTAPDSPSPASVGNRAPVEPDFWTELQLAFACSSENVSTGWVLMLLPALLLLFIAYDCYCLLQAGGQLNFSLNKYEARHVANRHSDDLLQQGLPPQLQNIVQSAKNNTAEQGWNFVGKYDGVDTFNKKIHGSKLLAFRGVALLDVHISQAMGPFINVTHALEWVSVLKSIEKMSIDPNATIDGVKRNCNYVDEDTDIIYQVLKLPWPIAPRDVLLERNFDIDDTLRQVTVSYRSIEDERAPIQPHTIRADSPHTMWRFTVVPINSNNGQGLAGDKQCSNTANKSQIPIEKTAGSASSSPKSDSQISTHKSSSAIGRLFRGFRVKMSLFWKSVKSLFVGKKSSVIKETAFDSSKDSVDANLQQTDDCNCSKLYPAHSTETGGVGKSWTYVEVETVVDSKGMIPVWFINYMQRYWPSMTLNTFRKLAKKGAIESYDRMSCW